MILQALCDALCEMAAEAGWNMHYTRGRKTSPYPKSEPDWGAIYYNVLSLQELMWRASQDVRQPGQP